MFSTIAGEDLRSSRGIVIVSEFSSAGSLATGHYTAETLKMIDRYADNICGIVAQHGLLDSHPGAVLMMPGVSARGK